MGNLLFHNYSLAAAKNVQVNNR